MATLFSSRGKNKRNRKQDVNDLIVRITEMLKDMPDLSIRTKLRDHQHQKVSKKHAGL